MGRARAIRIQINHHRCVDDAAYKIFRTMLKHIIGISVFWVRNKTYVCARRRQCR